MKKGVVSMSKTLMKKQGVSLRTLAKESIAEEREERIRKLEKTVNRQAAEINNLRDQIVALRQTVADVRNTAETVNQRTAGLMVFGR